MMSVSLVVDQSEFEDLCLQMRQEEIVAFDTEFISDDSYQPRLCLLQFAVSNRCVAVDPFRVEDLGSWWNVMADAKTTVVTHAGHAEIGFCLRQSGHRPRRLVDIQIAEGLHSRAYPLSYENLVRRVLGRRLHGTETRTDWGRRPLSQQQVQYALDDVRFVIEIWQNQKADLERLNRLGWAEAEFERMVTELEVQQSDHKWRRLSGIHRLTSRELAVARELCLWRDSEAARRDQPVRRVLRDDLIIELARRQPRTQHSLLATRGMNRSSLRRCVDEIIDCIGRGLAIKDGDLPERSKKPNDREQEEVLTRLLAIALTDRCAELNLSTTLVATMADVKEFVHWYVRPNQQVTRPRLCDGWRAEVCGELLSDLLEGKTSIRVADATSSHPLLFEKQ